MFIYVVWPLSFYPCMLSICLSIYVWSLSFSLSIYVFMMELVLSFYLSLYICMLLVCLYIFMYLFIMHFMIITVLDNYIKKWLFFLLLRTCLLFWIITFGHSIVCSNAICFPRTKRWTAELFKTSRPKAWERDKKSHFNQKSGRGADKNVCVSVIEECLMYIHPQIQDLIGSIPAFQRLGSVRRRLGDGRGSASQLHSVVPPPAN